MEKEQPKLIEDTWEVGFHAHSGIFFMKHPNGDVTVRKHTDVPEGTETLVIISKEMWDNLVEAMSGFHIDKEMEQKRVIGETLAISRRVMDTARNEIKLLRNVRDNLDRKLKIFESIKLLMNSAVSPIPEYGAMTQREDIASHIEDTIKIIKDVENKQSR